MVMDSSSCIGVMAVVAVSGSAAILAVQAHKRLAADFIKKVQPQIGDSKKHNNRKKVRFAADVVEPSSNNKEYRMRRMRSINAEHLLLKSN